MPNCSRKSFQFQPSCCVFVGIFATLLPLLLLTYSTFCGKCQCILHLIKQRRVEQQLKLIVRKGAQQKAASRAHNAPAKQKPGTVGQPLGRHLKWHLCAAPPPGIPHPKARCSTKRLLWFTVNTIGPKWNATRIRTRCTARYLQQRRRA